MDEQNQTFPFDVPEYEPNDTSAEDAYEKACYDLEVMYNDFS